MMMHDFAQQDIQRYKKHTIYSALALFTLIGLSIACAFMFEAHGLLKLLMGFSCGAALATINLFALGYAFNAVVIKKGRRWPILWPFATFLAMILASLILAPSDTALILGFALGLSVPIFFAAVIIFFNEK